MFNCIKSFSYKMNISANQVSNALRMKALDNTKPDTPKIAGNFFVNKFTIHLSKNHPFGGPAKNSTKIIKGIGKSRYFNDFIFNVRTEPFAEFSIVPILLFAGVWILIFTKLNRQYKKMKNFIEEFFKDNIIMQ